MGHHQESEKEMPYYLEDLIGTGEGGRVAVNFVSQIVPYYKLVREAATSSTRSHLKILKGICRDLGFLVALKFDLHVTAERLNFSSHFNYRKYYDQPQFS